MKKDDYLMTIGALRYLIEKLENENNPRNEIIIKKYSALASRLEVEKHKKFKS